MDEKQAIAIGIQHPTTKQLVEILKTTDEPRLTDEYFKSQTNLDYTGEGSVRAGFGRSLLRSAMRICRKEHGISWEREWGSGSIVRENAGMARNSTGRALKSTRRVYRKEAIRLKCTANGNMDTEEQKQHGALMAQVGTLAMIADGNARKKLEARNVQKPLDMGRLLEAFAGV